MWQKNVKNRCVLKSKKVFETFVLFFPEGGGGGTFLSKTIISSCVSKGIYTFRVSLTGNWNFSSFRSKCA